MLPDMSDTDMELLARYTRQHAEDAFAELAELSFAASRLGFCVKPFFPFLVRFVQRRLMFHE